MTSKRSDWLDVCRALAVLGVVACHCGQVLANYLTPLYRHIFQAGQYGVQLFFIISAITICASLARAGSLNRTVYRDFLLRRYFRIAPLYYLGILFYGAMWWLAAQQSGVTGFWHEYTPVNILANVLFVHTFVPTGANNIIVPGGWSIGVEMVFYVLAPLIYHHTKSMRWLTGALLVAWLGGSVIAALLQHGLTGSYDVRNNSYLYFWFPSQAFIFLIGFLVYRRWGGIIVCDGPIAPVLGVAGLVMFGLCYTLAIYLGMVLECSALYVLPIVGIGMGALVLGVGLVYRLVPGYRLLVMIGQHSYSIYLTHFVVQNIFLFAGKRGLLVPPLVQFGGSLFAFACIFVAVVAGSLVLSAITKRYVEDRFIRLGSQFIARWRPLSANACVAERG